MAAMSAMFFTFTTLQGQWVQRGPSSVTGQVVPTTTATSTHIISYNDIVTTYNTAVTNENVFRENLSRIEAMIAQERINVQSQIRDFRRSPYGSETNLTTLRRLETDLRMVRQLRQNNLSAAHRRIFLTYSSIQLPPTDGSAGLTRDHHADAIARLNHLAALSQYSSLADASYYQYPTSLEPYLTAALIQLPPATAPVAVSVAPAVPAVTAPVVAEVAPPQIIAPEPVAETLPVRADIDRSQMVVPEFVETSTAM